MGASVVTALCVALVACSSSTSGSGGGGSGGATGDAGTGPASSGPWTSLADRTCPSDSILTYENFGGPFVLTWCSGCHSGSLRDGFRQNAPKGMNFDSLDDIRKNRDRMWSRAGDDHRTMPPAGGPSPKERDRLGEWLACGARSGREGAGVLDAGSAPEPTAPKPDMRMCAQKRAELPAVIMPRCEAKTLPCLLACPYRDGEACRAKCVREDTYPKEALSGFGINCESCLNLQAIACEDRRGCHSVVAPAFCCFQEKCPPGSAPDCTATKCADELRALLLCGAYVAPECFNYRASPMSACFVGGSGGGDAGAP